MTQEHNSGEPENSEAKKRFVTKARAILAGGLVLGLGFEDGDRRVART